MVVSYVNREKQIELLKEYFMTTKANSVSIDSSKREVDVRPSNSKLLRMVVPSLGHNQVTSAEDLIDNCFDANASEVKIILSEGDKELITAYTIIDNGIGMNEDILAESFRFATETIHSQGDLGKFGVGGTVSSFTLGLTKKTITKCKGGNIIVGELDTTQDHDCTLCTIREPTREESSFFKSHCPDTGTIIHITNPRKLEYRNARHLINRLKTQLGITYHKWLSANRTIKLAKESKLNEAIKVLPIDPLYSSEDKKHLVKSTYKKKFTLDGGIITVRFMEINRLTSEQRDRKASESGLYFSRNNRQISASQAHKQLWPSRHQSWSAGRVEISFSEDLDNHFGLAALKNKVQISNEVVNLIKSSIGEFRNQVNWAHNNTPSSQNTKDLEEEDKSWDKILKSNAAILELQKQNTKSYEDLGSNITRIGAGNKTGSIIPTNSGITRAPRERITPKFEYVEEPRTKMPFWYHWEEGKMVITINNSHNFIKAHYQSTTEKILIKKFLTAHCLVGFDMWVDDEEIADKISIYNERVSEKLSAIDSIV